MQKALAQFDIQCNGRDKHSLFFVGDYFFRVDSIDTNPTAPIILDTNAINAGGISINNILDSAGAPETIYAATVSGIYNYWGGSLWINTGHTQGATNPGGTNQFIFSLNAINGIVYRYDGISNSIPIVTGLLTNSSIYDVATDTTGNFYLVYNNSKKLEVYAPNGLFIDSFPVTGMPLGNGAGLALLDSKIYALTSSGFYEGMIVDDTCRFISFPIAFGSLSAYDMASCPSAATPLPVISKKLASKIFVSPNPAEDYVKIKAEKLVGKSCRITITDVTGKKLKEEHVIFATGIVTLDVGELKSGIYFLRMEDGKGSYVRRFVKQ
ncbi:MAG TPA: T9SS type A sorting domain-containing protein [Bacteroidia bacterium]|nr:T9SS type A sorting domain-containing protein [Bacteroidia bacterium]